MPRCRANGLKRGRCQSGGQRPLFATARRGPVARPIQYRGGGGGSGVVAASVMAVATRSVAPTVADRVAEGGKRLLQCCVSAGERGCADSLDLGPPNNRDHGPPSRSVRAPIWRADLG